VRFMPRAVRNGFFLAGINRSFRHAGSIGPAAISGGHYKLSFLGKLALPVREKALPIRCAGRTNRFADTGQRQREAKTIRRHCETEPRNTMKAERNPHDAGKSRKTVSAGAAVDERRCSAGGRFDGATKRDGESDFSNGIQCSACRL